MPRHPVDRILSFHRIGGPWTRLTATGVANHIYATADIVLRIATDHPDAEPDARTESVAAPAAYAAGILTPRLIAFDESRSLVDRPYSIWERVHAETLGLAGLDAERRERVWRRVGIEIARLHTALVSCPDPLGYLDNPGRELDLEPVVRRWVDSGHANRETAAEVSRLIADLRPAVSKEPPACFVHNDLHEMNIMCTRDGELKAILDWGDAGWGDPILDFTAVPLDHIGAALAGYGAENRKRLGDALEARFIWDRLHNALDDAADDARIRVPVGDFRRFLDRS